jgi:hypothetical protein
MFKSPQFKLYCVVCLTSLYILTVHHMSRISTLHRYNRKRIVIKHIVAHPLKAGIVQSEETSVTWLWHNKQWCNNGTHHVTPHNQWSTVGNSAIYGSVPVVMSCNNGGTIGSCVFCWVRPKAMSWVPMERVESASLEGSLGESRVVSLQLAVGRQTHQWSLQTIAPGRGMGGGGAPIAVCRCLAMLS